MASRLFNQFLNTLNVNPVMIEGSFQLGSTGTPVRNSFVGAGIAASSTITVQKLGLGYYVLQLNDPYNRLVGWNFMPMPNPSSVMVWDNSSNIVTGRAYQIIGGSSGSPGAGAPSTATNWYQLGLNPGLDPTPGQVFIATTGGSSPIGSTEGGNGVVQLLGTTNIGAIEVLGCVNTMLAPTSSGVRANATGGSQLYFQTMAPTSTANGLTRFNPSSCTIRYNLFLRNSSRLGYNEASTSK